jgi:hypothetical protein
MESILNILALAALAVVLLLAVGFIGFKIPAPLHQPPETPPGPVTLISPPDSLPPAARRWLFHDSNQAPAAANVVAWGRGWIESRMRFIGTIWLPLSWTLYLVPGDSYVIMNRVTWFNRSFSRGGEEFRNRKGGFRFGKEVNQDPNLDETQRALAWFYSIWLSPASLIGKKDVEFCKDEKDPAGIIVKRSFRAATDMHLTFDPEIGLIQTMTSTRMGSKKGKDLSFIATFSQPRSFDLLGKIPTRFTASWDNDLYLKLELAGIRFNQEISDVMQAGLEDL